MIVFGEVRDGGFGPGVAAQAASEIRRVAEGMSAVLPLKSTLDQVVEICNYANSPS